MGIWKIKKRRWKYATWADLLKRWWYFSYLIFSRFIIFKFRNFTLCKMVLCIWRKKNFATMILWKKVILSCLKTNLKISHNLRLPDIFVKRFKPSKRYIATAELVKPPIWYLFKPLIMFKEDCFGLRNGGGGCLHVRGELFQIP